MTSLEKLLDSDYRFCLFSDSDFFRVVNDYDETNTLRRLYEKHRDCLFDISNMKEQFKFTNKATLINPIFLRTVLALYMKEKEEAKYWSHPAPGLPDYILVHYLSNKLTRKQSNLVNAYVVHSMYSSNSRLDFTIMFMISGNLIHRLTLSFFLTNLNFNFRLIQLEGRFVNMQIYSDLNEFIETHSVFNDLTINSLRVSFAVLLLSELVALFLFLSRFSILKRSKKPASFKRVKYKKKPTRAGTWAGPILTRDSIESFKTWNIARSKCFVFGKLNNTQCISMCNSVWESRCLRKVAILQSNESGLTDQEDHQSQQSNGNRERLYGWLWEKTNRQFELVSKARWAIVRLCPIGLRTSNSRFTRLAYLRLMSGIQGS